MLSPATRISAKSFRRLMLPWWRNRESRGLCYVEPYLVPSDHVLIVFVEVPRPELGPLLRRSPKINFQLCEIWAKCGTGPSGVVGRFSRVPRSSSAADGPTAAQIPPPVELSKDFEIQRHPSKVSLCFDVVLSLTMNSGILNIRHLEGSHRL